MAAQEWWDAVKHEVRDILVPGQVRRMAAADDSRPDASLPTTILPDAITAPSTMAASDTQLTLAATATKGASTTSRVVVIQTPTTSTAKPTATAQPSDSSDSGGMSTAAIAGIAIGALGGILVLFVLVYLMISSRRKKQERRRQQMEDDEKINGPFADSAAIRPLPKTPNRAPRLSLRPVTQFLPNFTQPGAERRASRGIALTLNPVSNNTLRPTGGSAWERPAQRSAPGPNGDYRPGTAASLNPFTDHHRLPEEPVSPVSSMGSFDRRVGLAMTTTSPSIADPVSPIIGDADDDSDDGSSFHGGLEVAPNNMMRKTSIRRDVPKPLDLTKPPSPLFAQVPPSPAGTEYSMHSMAPGQSPGPSASAAAIAAAGGPSQSTVHRVQLDFKPTLADEMGLRAGQLVRLLHEYDDGWVCHPHTFKTAPSLHPKTHNKPLPISQTQPVLTTPKKGPLHPPRPLPTRRRPPHLPLHPPCQAPPQPAARPTRRRRQPARRSPRQPLLSPTQSTTLPRRKRQQQLWKRLRQPVCFAWGAGAGC